MKRLKTIILILIITILVNLMSCFTFATNENETSSLVENITEEEVLEAFNDTLSNNDTLEEPEDETEEVEQTIHSEIDINSEFTDEKVLVFIKKNYSKIQQTYTESDFSYLELDHVRTVFEYRPEDNNRVAVWLELETPGKQNVIDAIAKLETDDKVYLACPNRMFDR